MYFVLFYMHINAKKNSNNINNKKITIYFIKQ